MISISNRTTLLSITLRLVDRHRKAGLHRELKALKPEGQIIGDHWYSRDANIFPSCSAIENGCLDEVRMQLLNHQLGSIAQLRRVKISQQHNRRTLLQFQIMRRCSREQYPQCLKRQNSRCSAKRNMSLKRRTAWRAPPRSRGNP